MVKDNRLTYLNSSTDAMQRMNCSQASIGWLKIICSGGTEQNHQLRKLIHFSPLLKHTTVLKYVFQDSRL